MDAGLSDAVREVFITLYRQGLIYRDRPPGELGPQVSVGDFGSRSGKS